MTDRHLHILRLVAHHRQRELDDLDTTGHTREIEATGRRLQLKRVAVRTRARVAEAEARRLRE